MNGKTGDFIWTKSVADQPWNVARTTDISGDGLDDILVGTLYNSNYCYFLDGTDGSEVYSLNHGQAVDAIAAIPDVTDDDSMEMVAGGRDGKLICYSGGLDALFNDPPYPPTINGPTEGAKDVEIEFTFVTNDPDLDDVYYYIEWGDGSFEDWIGPFECSVEITANHTWTMEGEYNIRAKAKDVYDFEGEWSDIFPINIIQNSPPSIPDINGKTQGDVGAFYSFIFTSTDPDGDDISYYIKWGDNDTTEWTTFYQSGENCSEGHKWTQAGEFIIQAKAKDIYGAESDWGTFNVEMPRTKAFKQTFPNFFSYLIWRIQILTRMIFK